MITTVADAIATLYTRFSEKVAEDLKNLFQAKHLYQSVRIDLNNFTSIVLADAAENKFFRAAAERVLAACLGRP